MLGELATLVSNVIFIIFLTTIVDLLLPGNAIKGFVKLIMGLFVIITILEPVGRLLALEPLTGWVMPAEDVQVQESIAAQSEAYQAYLNTETLQTYEEKLAQQMKGLIGLIEGVDDCRIQVVLAQEAKLSHLAAMEQVVIWLEGTTHEAAEEKVSSLLRNYYDLQAEQIEIHWVHGGEANEAG